MKTKMIASIIIIISLVAMITGGTMAWFSDAEGVTANTFAAGKIDLQLNNPQQVAFGLSNLKPSDSGIKTFTLTNSGTLDAALSISIVNFLDLENDLIEPETNPGYGTADYEGNGGELDIMMHAAVFVDVNQNGIFDSGDYQLVYDNQHTSFPGYRGGADYFNTFNALRASAWDSIMTIPAGSSVDLVIKWEFPTETLDGNYSQNIAMTDSFTFDLEFLLNQVQPQASLS